MKNKLLIAGVLIALLPGAGCNDIINSMDSKKRLSAEESAQALDDFIGIVQVASTSGCIFTFDFVSSTDGVSVTVSSGSGCAAIEGSGFIPYNLLSEGEGRLNLILNDCKNNDVPVTSYTGTITVGMSGSSGSITGYDFTGNITAEGEISGDINIDIQYNYLNCITNLECWSGSVNGYSTETLFDVIK